MTFSTVKKNIKKFISLFVQEEVEKSQVEKLQEILSIPCNSDNLGLISDAQLNEWITDQDITAHWESIKDNIQSLNLPEMTGGVNPGDQRAIFYLISALKPKNILEVGTHIGCSTVHIALALKKLPEKSLKTVDIRDVNNSWKQPWKEFNSPSSPGKLIQEIDAQEFTQFIVSTSLNFFENSAQTFDCIFLDGSHDADIVYQEIPLALQHLNPGGVILLHDYFANSLPLWDGYPVIDGPYLAIKRLQNEGANLRVIPLGELPWETKLGTKITSLALLTKN